MSTDQNLQQTVDRFLAHKRAHGRKYHSEEEEDATRSEEPLFTGREQLRLRFFALSGLFRKYGVTESGHWWMLHKDARADPHNGATRGDEEAAQHRQGPLECRRIYGRDHQV